MLLFERYGLDVLYREIIETIRSKKTSICPSTEDLVLNAFQYCSPSQVKVVIIGQDVYPQPGVATGLAFACAEKMQPSLQILSRELFKEYDVFLEDDVLFDPTLVTWAQQGVLLLNAALTCNAWQPKSHMDLWAPFYTQLLCLLNDMKLDSDFQSRVFVFLGKSAMEHANLISETRHFKIYRHHPAAEKHGSLTFEGFFKEVNARLNEANLEPISWIQPKITVDELFPLDV